MKKIFAFAIILTLFATAAGASECTTMTICKIWIGTGGTNAIIYPCNQPYQSHNSSCNNGWLAWDVSTRKGELMFSMALAAQMKESSAEVCVDTSGACAGNYDSVRSIKTLDQ